MNYSATLLVNNNQLFVAGGISHKLSGITKKSYFFNLQNL